MAESDFKVGDCIIALKDKRITQTGENYGFGFDCIKGQSYFIISIFIDNFYNTEFYISKTPPDNRIISHMFTPRINYGTLKENFTTLKIQRKEKLKKLSNINE